MTNYADKYKSIAPFVKLNLPKNKNKLSPSQKGQITRYFNKLKTLGYLNKEQEGYILKALGNSKYKISGMPKLKKIYVEVGTKIVNGKIATDTDAKVSIKGRRVYVERSKGVKKWEFLYNIAKEYSRASFKKHIQQQIGQKELKKGQYIAIGAGLYEMRATRSNTLDYFVDTILALAGKYADSFNAGEKRSPPEDFMFRGIVYEGLEAVKQFPRSQKRNKKKSAYSRIKGR